MIKFGSTDQLISQPLHYGFIHSPAGENVTLIQQSLEQNCQDLLQDKLDLAMISAVDYARNSSELSLVKDIAVISQGACKYALLFFQKNLQHIDRVAVQLAETQYHLLAKLVLNEFFEMNVQWQVLKKLENLEEILQTFPACFLEKDAALKNYAQMDTKIDIIEEWYDKTSLSYVHQLLALRRDTVKKDVVSSFLLSRELGMRNLMPIAKLYAASKEQTWDFYFDLLNETFQFFPTEETWDALREYFEYLFYYGIIEFLPDIHFYGSME